MTKPRTWYLTASFDTAFAYRKDGSILDESVFAKHHLHRAQHYHIAREEFGFQQFRDGIIWSQFITGSCQADWSKFEHHLEELAKLSCLNGQPEIDLVLLHYGMPHLQATDMLNGRFADFLELIAYLVTTKWRECFSSYVVSVENGYATAMQTDLQQWRYSETVAEKKLSWWELFEMRMKAVIRMAKALKQFDPKTPRLACEPFYKSDVSFRDQVRSLRTMLGYPDKVAQKFSPSQATTFGGEPDLLTDIGVNYYGNQADDFDNPQWPLSKLLLRAWKRFPNYNLRIAETGNCQVENLGISTERWLEMLDHELNLANSQGANVQNVTWAPFLTIEDFTEPGILSPGSLMDSQTLRPDPQLVKVVRQYTDKAAALLQQGSFFYLEFILIQLNLLN